MRRVGVIAAALATACLIPDREIGIEGEDDNPGAVRIVERTELLPEMDTLCNNEDPDPVDVAFCPQVPRNIPSGLLRPDSGQFCACPGRDERALAVPLTIYAEDPDRTRDDPRDTVYGVALIDPDPDSPTPFNFEAYRNYWDPCTAGKAVDPTLNIRGDRSFPSVGREETSLWEFRFDDLSGVVDLCNNNNGETLPIGLHRLQFMVSDRPFFRPVVDGPDGEEEGQLHCGVPDLAVGATYAVVSYVFECADPAAEGSNCDCAEVPPQ